MAFESQPAILVLQHYKENLRKCSLSHLRGRTDVEFRKLHPVRPPPQFSGVRGLVLATGAPVLSAADAALFGHDLPESRLVLLDSTWAKVDALLRNIAHPDVDRPIDSGLIGTGGADGLWFRSLPNDVTTAYPRRSKLFDDPSTGLASVEALVVAFEMLECPRRDLLEGYRWGREFIDANLAYF